MSAAEQVEQLFAQASLHVTEVEGCELAWQQWGDIDSQQPPLLLLHGGFGSWTHWAANLPGLMLQRCVWTVDLPGLGSSGEMPEPYSTEHFAALLLAGLQKLPGLHTQFELVGFSFGAMIGGHLAALAGEHCTRCTLIGAAGFGDLHVQVPLLPPPTPDTQPRESDAIQRENLARLMLYRPEAIDDLAVYIHADNLARHRFRSRKLAGSNDLADVLPAISAQLVGVWGEQDATAGGMDNLLQRKQLFSAAQAGAEFHLLSNVGHWAMYEAPAAINSILLG